MPRIRRPKQYERLSTQQATLIMHLANGLTQNEAAVAMRGAPGLGDHREALHRTTVSRWMTAAKASLQGIHDGVRVDTAASVVALAITYGVIRWDRHQEKYVVPGQGAPQ